MSITLVGWLALFFTFALAAFQRPVYGIVLYMLCYFLLPAFWWWGDPIETIRWSLIAGIVMLTAAWSSSDKPFADFDPRIRRNFRLMLYMVVNATIVHFVIAGENEYSYSVFELLLKFTILVYCILISVKTRQDFRIVMMAILIGGAYIGYEVHFNERGDFRAGRLEDVGAPGAATANHLASLMVTILPLSAPFFLSKKYLDKFIALLTAPLILNLVLLCNSRGAFLAAISSAIVFIVAAPKGIRVQAWKIIIAGSIATYMLMGDPQILERFLTTFVSEEGRDSSAQSRFTLAKAGLAYVKDHPLGGGGGAFKKGSGGGKYLRGVGIDEDAKSIHNGFINEACEWGIQGALLRIALYGMAMLAIWLSMKRSYRDRSDDNNQLRLAGCAFLAGCSAFLVSSLFGDHFSSEWGLWLVALILAYFKFESIAPDDNPETNNKAPKNSDD